MNKFIINRVLRSIDENIILIFYTTQKYGYLFYILGTSDFIYKILINKNFISCNCEDFLKHKILCKHLCFILFKVLKIYKIFLNNFDIKLIGNEEYLETNFFKNFKFEDLDWIYFKKKNKNINLSLKKNFFNYDYFNQFKNYYQQYYFLIHKKIHNCNDKCSICLEKNNNGIKCSICKKIFHINCLNKWFEKMSKKCPICRSDYWNSIYKYLILADSKKIKKQTILHQNF